MSGHAKDKNKEKFDPAFAKDRFVWAIYSGMWYKAKVIGMNKTEHPETPNVSVSIYKVHYVKWGKRATEMGRGDKTRSEGGSAQVNTGKKEQFKKKIRTEKTASVTAEKLKSTAKPTIRENITQILPVKSNEIVASGMISHHPEVTDANLKISVDGEHRCAHATRGGPPSATATGGRSSAVCSHVGEVRAPWKHGKLPYVPMARDWVKKMLNRGDTSCLKPSMVFFFFERYCKHYGTSLPSGPRGKIAIPNSLGAHIKAVTGVASSNNEKNDREQRYRRLQLS